MPMPNLKARDVFNIIFFTLDELRRPIALDTRCLPSNREHLGQQRKEHVKENMLTRLMWEFCLQR